jgi:hypothetical protein
MLFLFVRVEMLMGSSITSTYSDASSTILYPILPTSNHVSIELPTRLTTTNAHRYENIDQAQIVPLLPPPPVPPRPDRVLIQQRLSQTNMTKHAYDSDDNSLCQATNGQIMNRFI